MPEERKSKSQIVDLIFLAVILGLVVAIVLPLSRMTTAHPDRVSVSIEAMTFATALQKYRVDYGAYPEGGNAQLLAALQGRNPHDTVFFQAKPRSINPQGEFVDKWGTPFRIDLSDPKFPRIWSCGKDRIDNGGAKGSDDVLIDRSFEQKAP